MAMTINGTTGLEFPDGSDQTSAFTGNAAAITSGVLAEANGGTGTTTGYYGFKNRIINGAMVIDQRGGTISVSNGSATYGVDRWAGQGTFSAGVYSFRQTANYPAGFNYALYTTIGTADASLAATDLYCLQQRIEGYNVADLGWGTASAKTVTLSFWVRSNLTGTFGGSIANGAFDRSYPFTYTISVADTWEQKTITIAGDTTGTWLTTNGIGMTVRWSLGAGSTYSGTAGAWAGAGYISATGATNVMASTSNNFYITGVQLEKGSTATSFDYRPYGTELALCQRYYYKAVAAGRYSGYATTSTVYDNSINFPVTMRTAPTALEQSGTAGDYTIQYLASAASCTSVPTFRSANTETATVRFTVSGGGPTAGQGLLAYCAANGYLGWSAEL